MKPVLNTFQRIKYGLTLHPISTIMYISSGANVYIYIIIIQHKKDIYKILLFLKFTHYYSTLSG